LDNIFDKKIRVMKQEHLIWLEWNRCSDELLKIFYFKESVIKKWQYIYYIQYKPQEISLVEFREDLYGGVNWEIYCLHGELFEDVRRFASKQEAEIAIKKYLEPSYWRRFLIYVTNENTRQLQLK